MTRCTHAAYVTVRVEAVTVRGQTGEGELFGLSSAHLGARLYLCPALSMYPYPSVSVSVSVRIYMSPAISALHPPLPLPLPHPVLYIYVYVYNCIYLYLFYPISTYR